MTYDIAILGGGFSGAILAANLIRKASQKLKIALIEKAPIPARGIAYGTLDASHLLNVQAVNMGAFPDQPSHFYDWLEEHQSSWRHLDLAFADLKLSPTEYLPRHLYGFYLSNTLKEALELALEKDMEIELIHGEALDLERTLCNTLSILLASGEKIETHRVVLTSGVPPSKNFGKKFPGYTHNVWNGRKENPLHATSLANLGNEYRIGIIGTGLTFLDVLSTLKQKGYRGKVIALSKNGELPEIHAPHSETTFEAELPLSALGILKAFRKEIDRNADLGVDWRGVIDAFRPLANSTWEKLPLSEKKKVMKWLWSLWNRHRHRMPAAIGAIALEYMEENRLTLMAGSVKGVEPKANQIALKYQPKGSTDIETISFDHVFNCSGPEMNVEANSSSLIQNLLNRGFLEPHPLKVGINVTSFGEIKGAISERFFSIGQLLFGELFETTAVPELRVQCSNMADLLLARHSSAFLFKESIGEYSPTSVRDHQ